jgi:hypothetical protein
MIFAYDDLSAGKKIPLNKLLIQEDCGGDFS